MLVACWYWITCCQRRSRSGCCQEDQDQDLVLEDQTWFTDVRLFVIGGCALRTGLPVFFIRELVCVSVYCYVNWLAFASRHWVQVGPNLCWLQAKMDWTGSRVGKCWGDILWSTARGTWPTLLMSRCQSGIWTSPRGSSFEKVSLSNTWELTIVHVDKKDASQPETQLSCWKHHLAVSWTEQCSCKSGWPRFSLDCSSPATHKNTWVGN